MPFSSNYEGADKSHSRVARFRGGTGESLSQVRRPCWKIFGNGSEELGTQAVSEFSPVLLPAASRSMDRSRQGPAPLLAAAAVKSAETEPAQWPTITTHDKLTRNELAYVGGSYGRTPTPFDEANRVFCRISLGVSESW